MKFSNLDSSLKNDPVAAFTWRVALAFRLKGKNEAFEICDSLSGAVSDVCRTIINRTEIWNMGCENVFEKKDSKLCDN
jgi:hypothetical protein